MNVFTRIRVLSRIREEILKRTSGGMDPEQAGQEAIEAVKAEFATDDQRAIDWATLLPMILQLVTMIIQLIPKNSGAGGHA